MKYIILDPPVLTTKPQVDVSNTTVTVTWNQWTDTVDEGDGPVIGYKVCYTMIGGSWLCVECVLNLTASFVIDKFQRGLSYYFLVNAIRPGNLGEGTHSHATLVTIPCLSPEVAPTIVDVSSLGVSKIQVQLQLNDTEHWRCNSLDSYIVEYKKSESASFLQIQTATDTTSVTISNLEPCTSYQIKVKATNSGGLGPSSGIFTVTTDVQEPGDIAFSNGGVISSLDNLNLNWNIPSNPECITSFNVDYTLINLDQCNTSVNTTESQQFSATATEGVLSNLSSNSHYRLSLYAVLGNETTDPFVTEAHTLESKPTGKPLAVSNPDSQPTKLSFTWQPPECGKRNGPITKYKSRLKNSSYSNTEQMPELSVTFSSLLPCTEYIFQVRAVSGQLLGPWSDELHVKTALQEPDKVENVIINGSSKSLLVTWEAPDIQGCEIGFYKLEYQLENRGMCGENLESIGGTLNTTSTSIKIHNLEVFSQYLVTIHAVIGQVGGSHNSEGQETTSSGNTDED
ncbi:receptor-type tyrosine-protein phosphatase delta-like, partial [Anneissia japonica]|uniref:receptor-type tyrosine-protein phosphatase delta-like n=1 Tax=Anneissia japonica TaxID=1529436 RepID=UPI0014259912